MAPRQKFKEKKMKIRSVLQAVMLSSSLLGSAAFSALPTIDVYKSAYCGCCEQWVDHLKKNGFTVKSHDVPNPSDCRAKSGIPEQLGSCHTGMVNGYAIEGHVPAAEIKRLLAERPKARGLAVPSMPMGSPGMEGPRSDAYDVLLVQADGSHKVYQHYASSGSAQASVPVNSGAANMAMTDGEVRKVDKDAGKLTIKHGPITNLDMPAMTMVFRVKEASMLDQVKAGDKIKFEVDKIKGAYTVLRVEPAR
jgi:Cu/Ag efflux protein CusF